jgi:hypothetical protein
MGRLISSEKWAGSEVRLGQRRNAYIILGGVLLHSRRVEGSVRITLILFLGRWVMMDETGSGSCAVILAVLNPRVLLMQC